MSIKINKTILVLALISMIFVLNISYAKTSDTLALKSTCSNLGDFNIIFNNAYVVKSCGVDISQTIAKTSPDLKSLYVNVSDLAYPGAGAEFSVNIVNNGSISAKLQSINIKGLEDTNILDVEILDYNKLKDKILSPNDIYNLHFIVKWNTNSTASFEEPINFNLKINYTQAI